MASNAYKKHIVKRNLKYIFIIICLFVFSKIGFSQSSNISGTVTDIQTNPVEGAVIILYDSAQNIVSYYVTDNMGKYELEAKVDTNFSLEITHLSYAKKYYVLTLADLETLLMTFNFVLEENSTILEEIVFVGKRIEQDTVRFDLEKLNLYEDDNLKDILKKIPDFRLNDNGTIIYKGKNIDKILVNNKPSFENQNSIALENVENKIVEEISIIKNYNDDFSLDFDENQESVLNINTKNKSQNIITGGIEAKYGIEDKYEFKGNGLLFSQGLNAFLTHNTNNIGNTTITSDEVKKLFSEGQPFSPYQSESLGMLFASNENLQKDFFTSTNLTLRNQTQRFKTTAILYHIAPNRINSIIQNTSTYQNARILDAQEITKSKSQSILGALSLVYKISDNTIVKYKVNANYIDKNSVNTTENRLYTNDLKSNTNTSVSNNKNDIISGFHQVSMDSKLRKNMILETKGAFFHEDTEFMNDYTVGDQSTSFGDVQNFIFDKNEIQGSIGIKYKFSHAFIPLLSMNYFDTKEEIRNPDTNEHLIGRKRNDNLLNLKIKGIDVIRGMDYGATIGLSTFFSEVDDSEKKENIFIPLKLWLDYEKRMNRYYLKYTVDRRFSNLEFGINTIQPFNTIWKGNRSYPLIYSSSKNLKASYYHNNFFDAEVFSISVSYAQQKNTIRKGFIQQQNGISEYQLFTVDKAEDFSINGFYSKTISPLKYPTKIGFSLGYMQTKFPTQIIQQEVEITNKSLSQELDVETLTDNFINYSLSSKFFLIIDEIQGSSYKSIFSNSIFSILLKNQAWRGNIDFVYDNNRINGTNFSRKNINLGLSYTMDKISYSIEARHIGELLGIFENDAYNTQFSTQEGIINTIINNQSLNYFTLGIKYKL